MKKAIFALIASLLPLASSVLGQSINLSLGSAPSVPGGTVSVPLTLTSSGAAQAAAVEFSFGYSSDITSVSVTSPVANKSVSCSGVTCLLWSSDTSTIMDGTVAVATFHISAAPTQTTIPVQITSVVAASGLAASITASGNTANITLPTAPVITPSSLSCLPTVFYTPATSTCVLTISSSAPAGGFSVPLSSNNASLTVPANALVPAGNTSVQFSASAAQVSATAAGVLTAGTGATARTAGFTLDPPLLLKSLVCNASALPANSATTCTLSFNQAVLSNTTVSLTSTNTALTAPGTLTVLAGLSSGTFQAATGAFTPATPASASLVGSMGGQTASATITLQAGSPTSQLNSVTCTTLTLAANASTSCSVSLQQSLPTNTTIGLSSNNSAVTVPASVTVLANTTSASFTAAAGSFTVATSPTATITATLGSQTQTTSLTLQVADQLNTLTCLTATLTPSASTTCTLTLKQATAAGAAAILSIDNGAVSVPTKVTIPVGSSSAGFTVKASAFTSSASPSATVTASLGTQTRTAVFALQSTQGPTQLNSVTCIASTLASNATTTCTVSLKQSAPAGMTVSLSSDNTAVTVPPAVGISAGATSTTFSVAAGTLGPNTAPTATLGATVGAQTVTMSLALLVPGQLNSLTCSASSLASNASTTCTVTLKQPAPTSTTISLSSDNAAVTVPPAVSIGAGATSTTFSAAAGTLTPTTTRTANLGANVGAQTVTASLALLAPSQMNTFTCVAVTLAENASTSCTVTLQLPATTSTTISLTSNNAGLTVPPTVGIPAGSATASFTATASNFTSSTAASASITATLGSQTKSVAMSLQVLAQPFKSLTCSASTMAGNSATQCALVLLQPVSTATTFALKSDNPDLGVPVSVTIQAGGTNTNFQAATGTLDPRNPDVANITATLGKFTISGAIGIPMVPQMTSLLCVSTSLVPRQTTPCTITLVPGKAQEVITLSSSLTSALVPATVTAPQAAASVGFTLTAGVFTVSNKATISAAFGTQLQKLVVKLVGTAVSTISPQSLNLGVFRIRVLGSGFTPKSLCYLDGLPLATSFLSDHMLIASGTVTRSQSSSFTVSDGDVQTEPVVLQVGVARPRTSYSAAARFLSQAAYGPKSSAIMHLQDVGLEAWLNEQFGTSHTGGDDSSADLTNAVEGPDQLRQRVAASLAQVLRPNVSDASTSGDDLLQDVFGNYRQLLVRTQPSGNVDQIFQDATTGSAVAAGLIQTLVKSNPSAEYVKRVATVFDNNGLGERGNMQNVISAVLLDNEARLGDVPGNDTTTAGRTQSASEFVPGLLRALEVDPTAIAQLQSQPGLSRLPGTSVARTDSTQQRQPSARDVWVWNALNLLDLSDLASLADSPDSLVTGLDVVFLGGQMSSDLRSSLIGPLENLPDALSRARMGVFLVVTSSEYNVRR